MTSVDDRVVHSFEIFSKENGAAIDTFEVWDMRARTRFFIDTVFYDTFVPVFGPSLGMVYQHVKAYPIHQSEKGLKKSFHLIHASDHAEALKLMMRSYLKHCGGRAGDPGDPQQPLPML